MDNNYVVYCHTCIPNGKKYFGITNNIEKRWGGNGCAYISKRYPGTIFSKAILKYGWDNFEHTVLHNNLSRAEALELEKEYIERHKTNVCRYGSEYGYNMTDGGDGGSGCKASDLTRKRMSDAKKGVQVPRWKIERAINARRKPVMCIATGEVFESAHEAGRFFDISSSCITQCCIGHNIHTHNMRWRYATQEELDDYKNNPVILTDDQRDSLLDAEKVIVDDLVFARRSKVNRKPVVCHDLKMIFESARQAARVTGVSFGNIFCCMNGSSNLAGGAVWEYYTDDSNYEGYLVITEDMLDDNQLVESIRSSLSGKLRHSNQHHILLQDIDSMQLHEFESESSACRFLGVSSKGSYITRKVKEGLYEFKGYLLISYDDNIYNDILCETEVA